MHKITLLLPVLMLLSLSAGAERKGCYVSPRGSDRAPGTSVKPWKTLEYALKQVQGIDGDVRLVVMDGEYALTKTLELKGMNDRAVEIEAAPGALPVIRGDRKIVKFRTLKDKAVAGRLAPGMAGKVLEADLKTAGVKDLGNACQRENLVDLYWRGERQRLARYPNDGFLQSGKALGRTAMDDISYKEGIFEYLEDRVSAWATEKDAWIFGYFRWDWSDQYQKIEAINIEGKTVTLGGTPHNYGYKSGFRYYGLNLLCELDSPGEFYIDREKGKLYWYPPEGYSKGDEVMVSCFGEDYMIDIEGCSGITVRGLSFAGGRNNAIKVSESRNIGLEEIGIYRFGGDAVTVSDSRNVKVDGCRFSTLGHSGIKMYGGDRKTLEPAEYSVTNTVIRDFSLFKHTYEPAVYFKGCGLTIAHCDFSGSTSSAMRIDGSETLIEYNHFHDLVKESDDQGGLDMFYNYGYRGVVIRYNLWEGILGGSLHGAAGVRFDDMISGQVVYGNVFRNVGAIHFGAVQIHGGKDNIVENNVFYNCRAGVSFSPWPQESWDNQIDGETVRSQLYEDIDIDGRLYQDRYPELKAGIRDNVNRNIIKNNLAVGCRELFYNEKGYNLLQNNSALFLGESAELEKSLEYYLDPDILAGFGLKPIPYKEIGPVGTTLKF